MKVSSDSFRYRYFSGLPARVPTGRNNSHWNELSPLNLGILLFFSYSQPDSPLVEWLWREVAPSEPSEIIDQALRQVSVPHMGIDLLDHLRETNVRDERRIAPTHRLPPIFGDLGQRRPGRESCEIALRVLAERLQGGVLDHLHLRRCLRVGEVAHRRPDQIRRLRLLLGQVLDLRRQRDDGRVDSRRLLERLESLLERALVGELLRQPGDLRLQLLEGLVGHLRCGTLCAGQSGETRLRRRQPRLEPVDPLGRRVDAPGDLVGVLTAAAELSVGNPPRDGAQDRDRPDPQKNIRELHKTLPLRPYLGYGPTASGRWQSGISDLNIIAYK